MTLFGQSVGKLLVLQMNVHSQLSDIFPFPGLVIISLQTVSHCLLVFCSKSGEVLTLLNLSLSGWAECAQLFATSCHQCAYPLYKRRKLVFDVVVEPFAQELFVC